MSSKGSDSSQRATSSPGAPRAIAGPARLASLAARGERRLVQEELLEGEPIPSPLGLAEAVREVGDRQRIAGARQVPAGAKLRRQRLEGVARQRPHLPRPLAEPLGAQPLGRGMDRDDARSCGARGALPSASARAVPLPAGRNSWASTRKPERSSFPYASSRVPARRRSASQAWLNQTALAGPDSSATVASTIVRPRRRVGRRRAERTSTSTVACSPIRKLRQRRGAERSR